MTAKHIVYAIILLAPTALVLYVTAPRIYRRHCHRILNRALGGDWTPDLAADRAHLQATRAWNQHVDTALDMAGEPRGTVFADTLRAMPVEDATVVVLGELLVAETDEFLRLREGVE